MSKTNQYYFFPEQVKRGEHIKLISFLLEQSKRETEEDIDARAFFNDIHIYQEDDSVIVEWIQHFYNEDYTEGRFAFIDDEHIVMKEVWLPDNSSTYAYDDDEAQEILDDWLKDHPTWEKNAYGIWHDREEEERNQKYMEEMLKKEQEKTDGN